MEIYNFKDELLSPKSQPPTPKPRAPKPQQLIITHLKAGVKNPNRINVYVNNDYSFSLSLAQVVDLKIKVDHTLTPTDLENLQHASAYGKLHQRTLEWVLTRPRSIKETRDYLKRRQATPADIEQIIANLTAKNYLNDAAFAKFYIENRFTKKGISQRRLEMELAQKGISKDLIAETLAETPRSEEQEIRKIISRKIHQPKYQQDPTKLIQYLTRQGFSFELSQNLVHEMDSQNSAQNSDF